MDMACCCRANLCIHKQKKQLCILQAALYLLWLSLAAARRCQTKGKTGAPLVLRADDKTGQQSSHTF